MIVLRSWCSASVAACMMLVGSANTWALDIPSQRIEQQLLDAEFVFQGAVVNVQRRFAQKENTGDIGVPYTFVTYRVERVLKGNYAQPLATLRFRGGPAEAAGQFMIVEGYPLFDVGDQDLLLVKGNNTFSCPLVGCSEGRFRSINGLVVDELGRKILIHSDGSLTKGTPIDSSAITTHQLTDKMRIERHEVNDSGPGETSQLDQTPANATVAEPAGFASLIEQTIYKSHSPERLAGLPLFQSADPSKPFNDRSKRANATPPPLDPVTARPLSSQELREREAEEQTLLALRKRAQSPEFQQAQRTLNEAMEKGHGNFYAGTESPAQDGPLPVSSTSGRWLWLAVMFALLLTAGIVVWRRALVSLPLSR